jgi:hypothetical protein
LVLLFTYCSDPKITLQWEHVVPEVNNPKIDSKEIYELYNQTILEFYKGNIPKDNEFSYEDFQRKLEKQIDLANEFLSEFNSLKYFSEKIFYEATNGEEQNMKILVTAGKYSRGLELTMLIDLV